MTSLSFPVLSLLSIVVAIALLESKRMVGPTHPMIAPLKSKRIRGSTHPAFPLLFSPLSWKYCIVDPPTIQVISLTLSQRVDFLFFRFDSLGLTEALNVTMYYYRFIDVVP